LQNEQKTYTLTLYTENCLMMGDFCITGSISEPNTGSAKTELYGIYVKWKKWKILTGDTTNYAYRGLLGDGVSKQRATQ